jgi:hypothetical protein
MKPDTSAMRAHVDALFRDAPDGLIELAWIEPGRGSDALLFDVGRVDDLVARAVEWNRNHNVYIGATLKEANTAPFKRTLDEDAWAAWALWVDLDDDGAAERAQSLVGSLRPTLTVTTGRTPHVRQHLWFRLDEPILDMGAVRAQVAALAAALGGDPTVVNPGRIMRLAGSIAWPKKPDRIPELVEIETGGPIYSAEQIAHAFPPGAEHDLLVGAQSTTSPPSPLRVTGSLGVLRARVADGRETHMRDTVRAVFSELVGTTGAWPTAEEVFDAARPQLVDGLDLSRSGRISAENFDAELAKKCRAIVERAHRGALKGARTLEEAVAAFKAKRRSKRRRGPMGCMGPMGSAPEDADASGPSAADALREDLERAADMDRETWAVSRRKMARRHGVPVTDLDAMRAQRLRDRRADEAADEADEEGAPADKRGRRDLEVLNADLPDTARDLAERLADLPNLFNRGGPSRVTLDATRGASVVERLTLNSVVNLAHRVARPWQWKKKREGGFERANVTLPERVAKLYLDAREAWRLRPLDGVTTAPLLADDGTIRTADGYDAATRLWCETVPTVAVPDAPSRAEAEAALRLLRHHFRTFAFADAVRRDDPTAPVSVVDPDRPPGADESALLVASLTACARPCLWLAPALLVRAPALSGAGCGKGLLVRALAAIAFGLRPAAITAGGTAEELDKRLVAALIEAAPVLMLDNVNGTALRSDALAAAITERPAVVRPLGQSATVPLNPTAWVAITGNGVTLSEDLARRFVTVELDAGTEEPETRPFVGDFLADTFAARSALLAAALTIWRWGRRQGDALARGKALGSFGQWSRWCRDPLVALGCVDPVARVAETKARDPRRQAAAEVFAAWWRWHADSPVGVADLAEGVVKAADPAGRGRQHLASRIRALVGTRAAGFVLIHSPSVSRWKGDKYALRCTDGADGTASRGESVCDQETEF